MMREGMQDEKNQLNIGDEIARETEIAQRLDENGLFELYNPTFGLSYSHHGDNKYAGERNNVQKIYWQNRDAAEKPLHTLVKSSICGAALLLSGSIMADAALSVISYTGYNPLENALHLFRSLGLQNDPATNFNQLHMMTIGAAHGAAISLRQFFIGHYYKIKAKWKNE